MSQDALEQNQQHSIPIHTDNVIVPCDSKLLFVVRRSEPYIGTIVFPGGKLHPGETVEDAAVRELIEETFIDIQLENILGVYSDPNRDPREHRISTVFIAKRYEFSDEIQYEGGDDFAIVKWIDFNDLKGKNFGFDHRKIFEDYLKWIQTKQTYWSSKDGCTGNAK